MKKALALLGIIIFVFSIVPMGAFADDDDYPDHTNNTPPFIYALFNLFSGSVNVTFSGVELGVNGNQQGYYTSAPFYVQSDTDCIDIDFNISSSYPLYATDFYMLKFDHTEINNIDYIELYAQGSYESLPIFYYCYSGRNLYVFTAPGNQNIYGALTLRIHVKIGASYGFFVDGISYSSYQPTNASQHQTSLGEFYYLGALLRELDDLKVANVTVNADVSDIESYTASIRSFISTQLGGNTSYIHSNNNYAPITIYYYDSFSATNYSYYDPGLSGSTWGPRAYKQILFLMNYKFTNPLTFVRFRMPIKSYGLYIQSRLKATYSFVRNNGSSLYWGDEFSEYTQCSIVYINNNPFIEVNCYIPYLPFSSQLDDVYVGIKIDFEFNGTNGANQYIDLYGTFSRDTSSYHAFYLNNNLLSDSHVQTMYLNKILQYLQSINFEQSYPSGPSDPQDPNQTTNIYDVNIEFNTQVGDISVFENTYSQQLPTYDQSISDQYLVPVSNTYDFSDLNSTFNNIWQSSFQYDTDEEDNIVGVYGIGLYFIIPLVLLVLFALFRRITS